MIKSFDDYITESFETLRFLKSKFISFDEYERFNKNRDNEPFTNSELEQIRSLIKIKPYWWKDKIDINHGRYRVSYLNEFSILIFITKFVDEWFLIRVTPPPRNSVGLSTLRNTDEHYLCDQFDEVIQFMNHHIEY